MDGLSVDEVDNALIAHFIIVAQKTEHEMESCEWRIPTCLHNLVRGHVVVEPRQSICGHVIGKAQQVTRTEHRKEIKKQFLRSGSLQHRQCGTLFSQVVIRMNTYHSSLSTLTSEDRFVIHTIIMNFLNLLPIVACHRF